MSQYLGIFETCYRIKHVRTGHTYYRTFLPRPIGPTYSPISNGAVKITFSYLEGYVIFQAFCSALFMHCEHVSAAAGSGVIVARAALFLGPGGTLSALPRWLDLRHGKEGLECGSDGRNGRKRLGERE